MLNRNVQRILNIMIVLLLAGFVGFGAYMCLPARSPFGPMLGKIRQQLRAEMRYLPDLGSRVAPYAAWGLGGVAYGAYVLLPLNPGVSAP